MKIDHGFLHKTILENGGKIVGGYVRAWIANGGPCDNGWNDIDCIFETKNGERKTVDTLNQKFGKDFPPIDVRQTSTYFTDFYCNCWEFDGEIKMTHPANLNMTYKELEDETKAKWARCIFSWWWSSRLPYRVARLVSNGWKIYNPDKTPVTDILLKPIIKNVSVLQN